MSDKPQRGERKSVAIIRMSFVLGGTSRVPSSAIPQLKRWAIVGRPSPDEDQTDTAV